MFIIITNLTKIELNFLAHIYLSDNSEEIMIGNFIADSIRGNHFEHLPTGVIKGIKLHRSIDEYTDQHLMVKQSIYRLQPRFNRYAGIISDIFYDYFLAKNWTKYSTIPLIEFSENFYRILEENYGLLPLEIQTVLPNMIKHNWLLNYGNFNGIQKTLEGMTSRIGNKLDLSLAIETLKADEEDFGSDFEQFFPDLINHVQNFRLMLS